MRVLIVKLTSMGDLVHALPAITDAARAMPEVTFDWVVDEAFYEVASWHPRVDRIIKSSHRRWKQDWRGSWRSGELKRFLHDIRHTHYDIMIDAQNNMKSAIVTRLTKATWRCGLDKQSVRERLAVLAYNKKFAVPKRMHAIARMRALFSNALNYVVADKAIDYGIDRRRLFLPNLTLPEKYAVFVHNVSWESKGWPESYWRKLITKANRDGLAVLLPWGSKAEHERAIRLAKDQENAQVLPHLSLSEVAAILTHSQGAVCMDTGLSHIAAALDVPAVTMYGSTDPFLIGTTGKNQIHLAADFACAPCYKKQCVYQGDSQVRPACFEKINPDLVWAAFCRS